MTDTTLDRSGEVSMGFDVCAADAVSVDRGVAVLVGNTAVALFRIASEAEGDDWYAVDHVDPRTGVPVMARGLVGSTVVDGVTIPTVAAPLYKQRYDLRTGAGLAGETTSLNVWPVEIVGERVIIGSAELSPP